MTEQQLIAFFQDLHRHPELGYEETRTTQKVRQALEQAGIDLLPSGLRTGLIAVIRGKKPGKTIGLRADMDALPVQEETGLPYASVEKGKMHACGHDFHTTCMLGAALLLKERENELAGTVKIVFQPGEELSDGGGGKFLAASPALADVQEYYAGHTYPGFPAGTLGIKEGPVMAAPDTFTVRILGKGAHAGNPHLGIDPIPAAAALTLSLQTLITRSKDAFEPAVLSVTHLQAGTTWNVVPEEALLEGTLRTLREDLRLRLRQHLEAMAHSIAQAHGCQALVSFTMGPPPVINDAALCAAARETALRLGFRVDRQDNTMGGEDFSEYLAYAPGAFIRIGTGGGFPNHHPRFTADPAALPGAARFFAELALERAGSK